MSNYKTTLTPLEERALAYLADGKQVSSSEIAKSIQPSTTIQMHFLVAKGLVKSSKGTVNNLIATKYKITELGLKALENIRNGVTQEFEPWQKSSTEWRQGRGLH